MTEILIESQWNLKIGEPEMYSESEIDINRITVEFKSLYTE